MPASFVCGGVSVNISVLSPLLTKLRSMTGGPRDRERVRRGRGPPQLNSSATLARRGGHYCCEWKGALLLTELSRHPPTASQACRRARAPHDAGAPGVTCHLWPGLRPAGCPLAAGGGPWRRISPVARPTTGKRARMTRAHVRQKTLVGGGYFTRTSRQRKWSDNSSPRTQCTHNGCMKRAKDGER